MRLIIQDLNVWLSRAKVLTDVSFTVRSGMVVGLIGPNGAGKSTLMRAAAGQIPVQGKIMLEATDLLAAPASARARLLAYMPQSHIIAWRITAQDLVALGRIPWRQFGRPLSDADRKAVAQALEMMDATELASYIATELSGGEQARILAARAVAQETPVLILDEPVSGLDPAHQIRMMMALRQIAANGRIVLVSLHDLSLAARWCDEIIMMKQGMIIAKGRPQDVMSPEYLHMTFGVSTHVFRDDEGLNVSVRGLSHIDP